MVTAANIVPSIQTPDRQELKEHEDIQCKSAHADLSEGKIHQEEIGPENIFQKIDLLVIADWDPMMQQEAQDLIHEYACIFSQTYLDLGKIPIIKQSIKLTNPTPLKVHYRCIPPGMYEEVKTHIQEILDVGAI